MLRVLLLAAVCGAAVSQPVSAEELRFGETIEGATLSGQPAAYEFTAESPGVLTVVVRADNDVVINVRNERGREVDEGRIDIDYRGDQGAEQGAIVIGQAGGYQVYIEPLGFDARFVMAASWLPLEAVAREPDSFGGPEDAVHMGIGKIYREVINSATGDVEDWYRVEVPRDGLLNVATRTRSGDAVLDAYAEDDLGFAIEHSDQDIGGDTGRESITLDVQEGDVYYFVVSAFGTSADYTVRAVMIDN